MAFSCVRKFFREYMTPEEVDSRGNLNPKLLAITTKSYRIQSQDLGIPDSWGFFSHGSPRLQVCQAARFITAATFMGFVILPSQGLLFVLTLDRGVHTLGKLAIFAACNVWFVCLAWLIEL